jgi:hypothetical protein
MAEIRNTSARNEAHVASADYRNPHGCHSSYQPPFQAGGGCIAIIADSAD